MTAMKTLEQKINYTFKDKKLLENALTHSSYAHETRHPEMCNERLEFLGDSVLSVVVSDFLYKSFPKLPEALRLIEAWGFQYKTVGFVWVKTNPSGNGFFLGLGWWTRSNAEICLLAVRGKPKRQCAGISQLIISPRERHSKKPDIVRDLAISLVGDVPRIELFARETSPGWDVWGNEVDCSITLTQSEGDAHE